MALATRPKPKAHDRKRQARHHNHGKAYLKTYWPYLPMLVIVGVGALANRALYHSTLITSTAGAAIGGSAPSRLQSLFGTQTSWIFISALLISIVAFSAFIVVHWYRFRRLLNKGETFVIRHPWLEIATVAIFTVGFVLTRSATIPH